MDPHDGRQSRIQNPESKTGNRPKRGLLVLRLVCSASLVLFLSLIIQAIGLDVRSIAYSFVYCMLLLSSAVSGMYGVWLRSVAGFVVSLVLSVKFGLDAGNTLHLADLRLFAMATLLLVYVETGTASMRARGAHSFTSLFDSPGSATFGYLVPVAMVAALSAVLAYVAADLFWLPAPFSARLTVELGYGTTLQMTLVLASIVGILVGLGLIRRALR